MLFIFCFFFLLESTIGIRQRHAWEDLSLPLESHQTELHPIFRGQGRRLITRSSELTPLYEGYGTHFAYVYVGTPPQRQSVIIDTGSHLTAFPCNGCDKCGEHTDPYFKPKQSSTAKVVQCQGSPCVIRQSYAEGSSWAAVTMNDRLWVGGLSEDLVPRGSNYSINFKFGCQSSETGLFRTQLADGIMGMSISDDSLPSQLFAKKIASSRVFALCYRIGGGIMTLGGVNQNIHSRPSVIQYAKQPQSKGSEWFTVTLLDIKLRHQVTKVATSVSINRKQVNGGKGVIIDSGTTDTYLSSSISSKFKSLFKQLSGVDFSTGDIRLTSAQLDKIPDIVFVFAGMSPNTTVEVAMPWSSFVDSVGSKKYAFRVYLTENSGSVLGANFMMGQNVIFDRDAGRVGFAPSSCIFQDYRHEGVFDDPNLLPIVENKTEVNAAEDFKNRDYNASGGCVAAFVPLDRCTAKCWNNNAIKPYRADGYQRGVDNCKIDISTIISPYVLTTGFDIPSSVMLPNKDCHELCVRSTNVPGKSLQCIVSQWSDCKADKENPSGCSQSRTNYKETKNSTCGVKYTESRDCYADACPVAENDYLVFLDMKVEIPAILWSYAYTNTFVATLCDMFKISPGSISLLNNAGDHDMSTFVKLHFEIRLQASSYKHDIVVLTKVAEGIPLAAKGKGFSTDFINMLNYVSIREDTYLDFSRYGWMKHGDIEVTNTISLPLGNAREHSVSGDVQGMGLETSSQPTIAVWFLVGVTVSVLAILLVVIFYYMKLQREHWALTKQKLTWQDAWTKMRGPGAGPNYGTDTKSQAYQKVAQNELELGNVAMEHALDGIMSDNKLDDEDYL